MINTITDYFRNSGEFTKRIKSRHDTFWKDAHAETIRNSKMSKDDHFEKWRDIPHWQRRLSNKFNAREFAHKHDCILPELYWKGADVDNIDFTALPANYVIRPTTGHCSSLVFLMRNGLNLFDRKRYTSEQIREILRDETQNKPHLEFLFEEFLEQEQGEYGILNDYKFFCFNGKIACIQVINRVGPNQGYGSFYDENWNKLKKVTHTYKPAKTQSAPSCLSDMVASAKKLSEAYGIFVRIDFYATYKGCVFGEFTPTPSMGRNYSSFGRKLLLRYWDEYCAGLI